MTPSSPASGESSGGLLERDEAAGDAELVLQRDRALERVDVLLPVEQEQVADPVQVDLCSGPLREALECFQAPEPDRDVEWVGELSPHPTGRLARRPGGELGALDQQCVDSGLCQVERNARADHAAADDHDVGLGRERPGVRPHGSDSTARHAVSRAALICAARS